MMMYSKNVNLYLLSATWLVLIMKLQVEGMKSDEPSSSKSDEPSKQKDICAEEEEGSWLHKVFKIKRPAVSDLEIVELALQFQRNQQYDEALRCFNKAIKQNPSNASYYILRGDCYLDIGGYRSLCKAMDDFQMAVEKDPENMSYRLFWSEKAFENGYYYSAVEAILPTDDVEKILELSSKLHSKKAFMEAARCYTKLIEKNPSELSYYRERVDCYLQLKNNEAAAMDLEKLVQADPENKDLRFLLSRTLYLSKQYEKAVNAALFLDEIPLAALCYKLYLKMKYEEAIFCYTNVIEKHSKEALYYECRGICYYRLENLEKAILDFQKLLEITPFKMYIRELFAEALLKAEKYDEALECLEYFEKNYISDGRIPSLRKEIRQKQKEAKERVSP